MKYKKEVEEFLHNNFVEYKVEVGVNLTSIYIIYVHGYNCDHCFSIKLSTFPEDEVALFGYGDDIIYEMNEENLHKIFDYALTIKQFGKRIGFNVDGKRTGAIEFIDEEPLTPERAKEIYREHRRSKGKWVLPCILECSNFDGSINFSVQVY